jgi:hypothetical protein
MLVYLELVFQKSSSRELLSLLLLLINTARPGVIIGKGGQEVDKLKEELKKLTKKKFKSTSSR